MSKKSTAVATKSNKGGAITGGSSIQQAMAAAAGAGNESLTQTDLAIPFVRILQDLSPQTKKRDEAFVEGAEAGMLYESVSQSVWPLEDGALMIPCHYQFMVNEWKKRTEGGGYIASHPDMVSAIENCADSDKHDLVDTHQHAVLIRLPNGTWSEAIFPMKSSAIKASRQWNSLVNGKTSSFIDEDGNEQTYELPRFFGVWRFRTAEKSNDQGTFFVPKTPELEANLEDMGPEGEALFNRAFAFYRQCVAGEAQVDYRKMDEAEVVEEDDEPGF